MTILAEILARKAREVEARRANLPERELEARALATPLPRSLAAVLSPPGGPVRIVAEVKRASPSAGAIDAGLDAPAQAARYAAAGAAAVSVLTDGPGFGGSLDDLLAARARVEVPLLRKDFVLERYQLLEARAWGADAALLIVSALPGDLLRRRLADCDALGLSALVEVHDLAEAEVAVAAGARIVGVNNRDLRSFRVDLGASEAVLPALPEGVRGVSESGIRTPADVARLRRSGAANFLVGEALVRAPGPRGPPRRDEGRPVNVVRIKICGVTRLPDALDAARLGADALGFNFWPRSKRYVTPAAARQIIARLPPFVTPVGVFVNQSEGEIRAIAGETGIQVLQLHGDEPPELCSRLPLPVVKAIPVDQVRTLSKLLSYEVQAFLLDTPSRGFGGTGRPSTGRSPRGSRRSRR